MVLGRFPGITEPGGGLYPAARSDACWRDFCAFLQAKYPTRISDFCAFLQAQYPTRISDF